MTWRTATSPSRPAKSKPKQRKAANLTFLEHVQEIRARLFWVGGFFVVASAAAFPLADRIIDLLIAPLGNQQLYYLTPAGGFGFLVKICTYVGLLAAIPVLVYHLYKYVEPLMQGRKPRAAAQYVAASVLLAASGLLFAYLIILPAALHFLGNLHVSGLQSMLTADAYLSFVIVYLVGTAALFQIPIVLLIINMFWPLSPRKLMGAQRYVVVGAFVIAAIISPTLDMMNQLLLALPVIVLFQVGVAVLWLQRRLRRRSARRLQTSAEPAEQA